MASIEDRFKNLLKLSADERTSLADDIELAYYRADAAEDFDLAEELIEMRETVNRVSALAEDVDSAADAEDADKLEASDEDGASEDEKSDEKSDEQEPDTKTERPRSEDEDAEQQEETAMAASAGFQAPDKNKPVTHETRVQVRPRAGAELGFIAAGADFSDMNQINRAFIDKIQSMRGTHGGDGEQRTIVSLLASIDESRQLSNTDTTKNMQKIDAIISEDALVASGGWCAPAPINYNILGVGSTIRPVRDSLPTFGASRGGIRYIRPPLLGAYNDAISLWTAENDINPTNPTKKPSLKVSCAEERQTDVDAVTLSLIFGNLMTRAFPELVQRHNELALIQHARFAERTLLNKIAAESTKVTTTANLGSARDLLFAVARASAAYRNRHRIPPGVRLRAIMPEYVRDILREDIASNMAVENLSVADSVVDRWFADRGLNITWHIDDTFESQAANAELNPFPSSVKWWLFTEGTFLFLDGGTLDLGIVRDSNLVDTNDYRTFVETFEGLAKVGIEALQITSQLSIGKSESAPATP